MPQRTEKSRPSLSNLGDRLHAMRVTPRFLRAAAQGARDPLARVAGGGDAKPVGPWMRLRVCQHAHDIARAQHIFQWHVAGHQHAILARGLHMRPDRVVANPRMNLIRQI